MRKLLLALLIIIMAGFGVIGYTEIGVEGEIEIVDDSGTEHLMIQTIAITAK